MSRSASSHDPSSVRPQIRNKVLSNEVMGMLLFIVVEIMFFAGLISAFLVVKSSAVSWPPPDQPRLPVEVTAVNTLILLISALTLFKAHKLFSSAEIQKTEKMVFLTMIGGGLFVLVQGFEWIRLISYGLTMTSSSYGGFFYLIIGTHALHVIGALACLYYSYKKLKEGIMIPSVFHAVEIFWYFVVGLWPILYYLVYISKI